MPLTLSERISIEHKISVTIQDHIREPFLILRESGMVAELRNNLRPTSLGGRIRPGSVEHGIPSEADILRLQMEMTAVAPTPIVGVLVKKSIDLVVLKAGCILRRARNGSGDILEQIPASSVDAAVEIKSRPSSEGGTLFEYLKDISALLWLNICHDVAGYFVVFDKSDSFYDAGWEKPKSFKPLDWKVWHEWRGGGGNLSMEKAGVIIKNTQPVGEKYIEVWFARQSDSNNWVVDRKFALQDPQRPNKYYKEQLAQGVKSLSERNARKLSKKIG